MTINKEKAINLILLGFTIQFAPLIIFSRFLAIFEEYLNSLSPILNPLISLLILGLFLVGYGFFVKGCGLYIENKGYNWGWLGLLSIFGLSVLLLIPTNKNVASLEDESLLYDPFKKINIPELLLTLFISLPVLSILVVGIFSLLNNLSFSTLLKNTGTLSVIGIIIYVAWLFILLTQFPTTEFIFNKIIGYKNKYNWKIIILITVFIYAFSKEFNSLSLYVLSFVLPDYVEYYINDHNITNTNIWELIFRGFSVMLLAPVTEEFLFRGIILQKWAIKWGVKAGILTSSFLFAIIHFRFDIISLSLMGIILSILYLKTRNLLAPIFCHFFYNTFYMIFTTINYFSQSEIERIAFISLQEYQNSVQPLLGQRVFLISISAPFLIYFVYKNFPKNDAIIPYYANNAKTDETN
ncbi:type II CAAX endopeptidase family protein [Dolichospermum planctonicum CS-1226]|uniref:Type II CAAX endopeptidase family protein n=1 Tax=Dolichospermum planctonicum CS-1226 TaxID=3021751 RepID=A0ABT5AG86_9CYAN|nr:type II CAAX endopeptidase family protein [Dolichospermum planctonicum]MDB9536299.1 type II CAAX endopeptidase family protein [Dolichospermum planctonicum CS-1226]